MNNLHSFLKKLPLTTNDYMKIPGSKFSTGQHVIILNMYLDGDRKDFGGYVVGQGRGKSVEGRLEVKVNGVSLYFAEHRLMDYEQYWVIKNAQKEKNE